MKITSIAPPPATTASFLMARRTIIIASCKDRSVSSMNCAKINVFKKTTPEINTHCNCIQTYAQAHTCSAPPRMMIVHERALGQPVKKLYLDVNIRGVKNTYRVHASERIQTSERIQASTSYRHARGVQHLGKSSASLYFFQSLSFSLSSRTLYMTHRSAPIWRSSNSSHSPSVSAVMLLTEVCTAPPQARRVRCRSSSGTRPALNISL